MRTAMAVAFLLVFPAPAARAQAPTGRFETADTAIYRAVLDTLPVLAASGVYLNPVRFAFRRPPGPSTEHAPALIAWFLAHGLRKICRPTPDSRCAVDKVGPALSFSTVRWRPSARHATVEVGHQAVRPLHDAPGAPPWIGFAAAERYYLTHQQGRWVVTRVRRLMIT